MYPPWFGFNDPSDWMTPWGGSVRNEIVLYLVTLSWAGLSWVLTDRDVAPRLAGLAFTISLLLGLWWVAHRVLDIRRSRRASRQQAEQQGD